MKLEKHEVRVDKESFQPRLHVEFSTSLEAMQDTRAKYGDDIVWDKVCEYLKTLLDESKPIHVRDWKTV